jgi:hypothetical protein
VTRCTNDAAMPQRVTGPAMENERANFFAVTHNTANSAAMRARRAQSLENLAL